MCVYLLSPKIVPTDNKQVFALKLCKVKAQYLPGKHFSYLLLGVIFSGSHGEDFLSS